PGIVSSRRVFSMNGSRRSTYGLAVRWGWAHTGAVVTQVRTAAPANRPTPRNRNTLVGLMMVLSRAIESLVPDDLFRLRVTPGRPGAERLARSGDSRAIVYDSRFSPIGSGFVAAA